MNEPGQSEEDHKTKRHTKFIAALEKHGSSPRAWDNIASELKWSVGDVKVHAYSYFKAIVEDRNRYINHRLIENGDIIDHSSNSAKTTNRRTTSWTFQESILLDTLMFKHCDDIKKLGAKDSSQKVKRPNLIQQPTTVWEKIASSLPGKNVRECEKEGMARLRNSYLNKSDEDKEQMKSDRINK